MINLQCLVSRMLILISSLGPILGFYGNNNFPTEADIDEAFRLTSWFNNDTSRDMIIKYLILCPEQDMCLGPMFKRNYTFTQQPACTPCECDDSCVRRSTCCPSKFYRQTDTPDFIEYQRNVNVEANKPLISCMEPMWNPEGIRSGTSYWMVQSCPNDVECISPPSKNISINTPVTSLVTHRTYRNVKCALCNFEQKSKLVGWEKKKSCSVRSALFTEEDTDVFYQLVFSASPICNIEFYPTTSYKDVVQSCVAYTNHGKCNKLNIQRKRASSYLTTACREFNLPYFLGENVYKNIYCALCEHQITNLPIQYNLEELHNNEIPTSFSALIDLKKISDEPITKNDLECEKNQIKDTKMNMCLDIHCEAEYMYHNRSCSLVHQMVNENNYEMNLIISPVDEKDLPPIDIYLISIEESLTDIIRHNNLDRFVCRISYLIPSESDRVYIAVVIELSFDYLHNIDQMIEHLLEIFNSYRLFEIPILEPLENNINVSLTPVGQRFHSYGSKLFEKHCDNRFFVNPMDGKEMKLYQCISMVPYRHDQRHPYCSSSHMMSIVADWYRCPKVKINSADARLHVSNFSVCLLDYQTCIASNYFKESLDKHSVLICLEQYLQATKVIKSNLPASDDNLMASFSLVCLSLSSFGSLATIFTFLASKSCSQSADVNIIILAVFLFLANTARVVSQLFVLSQTMCISVGMLVHICWLSVVCWISLSFFQMFHSFKSFCIMKLKVISRVLYRLIVNLIICSSLVAINVTFSYVTSNGDNLGYSIHTCYITNSDMILYTFALPVGLLISFNMLMFAAMMCRIPKRVDIQVWKDDQKMEAYFRLSNIIGATWMFAFLAQFTGFQLCNIVHTVLNGCLGFFLYLAFGQSLTTKHIYKKESKHSTKLILRNETYKG